LVFVKIVVLLFWTAYSWSMGQTPEYGLNAFGKFVSASFFLAAPALYLLPSFEAWKRDHANLTGIALVNVFLGWTLIGWVVALVWAHKKPEPAPVYQAPEARPAPSWTPAPAPVAAEGRPTKACPFCAETVLAAAIKCKHCGSDLREPAAQA
jgi:hypothetical protein